MSVTHKTVATGVNDATKQVSKDAWNEAHEGTNDHGHTATGDGGTLSGFETAGAVTTHEGTYDHTLIATALQSESDPVFLARTGNTKHYTGFPEKVSATDPTTLSWADANYTLTISGTNFKIYIEGTEYTVASSLTKQITDATGLYWFWIELSGGNPVLNMSTDSPGFGACLVATVYWNTVTDKGILADERHWMGRDKWMHEYLHETVGARYHNGMALTAGDTTFTITEGVFYDEDIEHTLPESTACRLLYKNGSAVWQWDDNSTTLYKLNGTSMRYNNGNAIADVDNSKFAAMWIFATNNTTYPFGVIIGQRQDATIALARANNTPNSLTFGTLPAAEMKLLYRVIFQQGVSSVSYVETADYRNVSNIPVSNYTATDHTTLTNVGTNTHAEIDTYIATTAPNTFEPKKGDDDNYVTDAEKIVIGNTSGTNSGNQIVPADEDGAANNFLTAYDNTNGAWSKARPTWANIDKATSSIADITTKSHTALSDIGTVTHANLETYLSNGWYPASGTWSYSSADDPTFIASVNADVTAQIGVGMRIKMTNTTVKYFIVTVVGAYADGVTLITLYGGTDYDLADAACTGVSYSMVKCPFGFPLSPAKWTVTTTNSSNLAQATPSQNTWYNVGSVSISVPIGCWDLGYESSIDFSDATAQQVNGYITLSTANNSESDSSYTCILTLYIPTNGNGRTHMNRHKVLSVDAKTSYYLNYKTSIANLDSIGARNDVLPTNITAVCAYL